jgi:hypothetical protein
MNTLEAKKIKYWTYQQSYVAISHEDDLHLREGLAQLLHFPQAIQRLLYLRQH